MLNKHPASISLFLLFSSFFVLGAQPTHAVLLLQAEQLGNDVVITGSGSANTSALTNVGNVNDFTNVLTDSQIAAGPEAFDTGLVTLWSGITGPVSFGSDPNFVQSPDSGSGTLFGIIASNLTPSPQIFLPQGYSSGASLVGTSTFANSLLTSLGFVPGSTFTWLWGSGGSADSLVLNVLSTSPAQVPAPLPIAGASLAFAQSRLLRRRLKRSRPQANR